MCARYNFPKYRKRISATGEKVRNVIVLIYIEDLEAAGTDYFGLLEYLASLHMECCCSPIHNRDKFTGEDVRTWCEQHIDSETGDLDVKYVDNAPYVGKPKKPHVHVLFKGPSQQNAEWWSNLMAGLLEIRVTMWDKCLSVKGSIRYWCHMDDPNKAQYSKFDVMGFAGIDLSPLDRIDTRSANQLADVVYDMIQDYNLMYFHELMDTAAKFGDEELMGYLRGSHALWKGYLGSKAQKRRDSENAKFRVKRLQAMSNNQQKIVEN